MDELVGSLLDPATMFGHAMSPKTLAAAASVSFPDPLNDGQVVEELIDHILVSPRISNSGTPFKLKANACQVEQQAYDAHDDDTGAKRKRGLRPSDHRPVSAVLEY